MPDIETSLHATAAPRKIASRAARIGGLAKSRSHPNESPSSLQCGQLLTQRLYDGGIGVKGGIIVFNGRFESSKRVVTHVSLNWVVQCSDSGGGGSAGSGYGGG